VSRAPRTPAWTVIGAGSILPRAGYGCAGYALGAAEDGPATLFDCGPGTVRALGALGIELTRVTRVVLSHFHPDHCLDLFALAFARTNPNLAGVPAIELVGPRGLGRWLEDGARALGGWTRFRDATVREVEPEPHVQWLELAGLRLSWVHNRHTDTSLSWRAELPDGASVTYTGDTCEDPAVAELARETDLFVAECSFPDEAAVPNHLTPSSAARLARDARARRLVLTHFYPETDPEEARRVAARTFAGPIELARDGARFAVERASREDE